MSSCSDGAEPAIDTQMTSAGRRPTADSHPATARCQMPAVAVPDARRVPGAVRIACSRSRKVCHGASLRTNTAAASRLTSPMGAKSRGLMLVIWRQWSMAISTVTSVIV